MAAPRRVRQGKVRQKVVQNIGSGNSVFARFALWSAQQGNPFKIHFRADENNLTIVEVFNEFRHQDFPTQIEVNESFLDVVMSRAWVFHPGTFAADENFLTDGIAGSTNGPFLFAKFPIHFRVNFSSNNSRLDVEPGAIVRSYNFVRHYIANQNILTIANGRLQLARDLPRADFVADDSALDAEGLILFYSFPDLDYVADDFTLSAAGLTRIGIDFKGLQYQGFDDSRLLVRFAPGEHLFIRDVDMLANDFRLQVNPRIALPNLFVWAANDYGQMGQTPVNVSAPVAATAKSYVKVAIGKNFRASIDNLGQLWTIGDNQYGQLGVLDVIPRSSPVQVSPGESWIEVAAGTSHVVAIRLDGSMWSWGANNVGQLGIGLPDNRSSPTACAFGQSFSKIAAGASHSMAIRSDGALFTWGGNHNGQLARNGTSDSSDPVQVGALSWREVACGERQSAAIRGDSTLWTWGANNGGQGGRNNTIQLSSPTQVTNGGSWNKISIGGNSTTVNYEYMLAIKSDGTLWSCGDDHLGRLGRGPPNMQTVLSRVFQSLNTPSTASWTWIAAGDATSYGIQADGSLWAWGAGNFGYLGTGSITNVSLPVKVGSASWTKVFAGPQNAAALPVSPVGALQSWGQDYFGEFNGPSHSARHSPVLFSKDRYKQVSTGSGHTLAIRNDGILFACGQNDYGQLGDGTQIKREEPVQIGTESWRSIAAGQSFSVAIRADGTLWSWGLNIVGELGTNNSLNKSSPVQVGALSWLQIATNWNFVLAIRDDRKLFAWGHGNNGKLGNGNTASRSSPVQIGSSDWSAIACGTDHAAAIDINGRLFTWGFGAQGQLGSSGTGSRSSPGQVLGSWKAISCGDQHVMGIKINDMLFSWGDNSSGQLGLSSLVNKSSPTQVGTDSWLNVNAGYKSTQAVREDFALFTWGDNRFGQRAHYIVNSNSPVQVTGIEWGDATRIVGWTTLAAINNSTPPPYRPTLNYEADANELQVILDRTAWQIKEATFVGEADLDVSLTAVGEIPLEVDFNGGGTLDAEVLARIEILVGEDTSFLGEGALTAAVTAVAPLGNLYIWGNSRKGQSGFGISSLSSPVLVDSKTYTKVVFGHGWRISLDTLGQMWVCGGNEFGQLGDGTKSPKSSPIQIGIGSSWIDVSAGNWHAAAIRLDGGLFTWGLNSTGQLGDSTTTSRSSPAQVGTSSWLKVAAGGAYTLAIKSDSSLWAWGFNNVGQLGNGGTATSSSPSQVGLNSWSKVYAGNAYSAGITSVGTLFLWGQNNSGNLGDNTATNRSSPVSVTGGNSWLLVSLGDDPGGGKAVAGIRVDGSLWAWGGGGGYLRLANKNPIFDGNASSPLHIGTSSWIAVAQSQSGGIGIHLDGGLWSWGDNTLGEAGLGHTNIVSSPTHVGTDSWTAVFATWDFVSSNNSSDLYSDFAYEPMGAIRGGALYAWGTNNAGEFGSGSPVCIFNATKLDTQSWKAIASGFDHSLYIRDDGALFAMGNNLQGQLGDGTNVSKNSPVQIGTSSWIAVAAGLGFSLAIRADGGLFSWGSGGSGRLGSGSSSSRNSPGQIGTSSWMAIACGIAHAAAITSVGGMFCWGEASSGQVPPNQIFGGISTPQSVGGTWSKVSCGYNNTFAIDSIGRLFAWGDNHNSVLGLNNTSNRSSPTQVGGSWTQINSGDEHALGIKTDGTLWAWGVNTYGQVGNNTLTNASAPTQIGTSSWLQVSGMQRASVAIRLDGTLWSWGDNSVGQLGAEHPACSSPVQVGALTNFVKLPESGFGGGVALTS